MGPVVDASGGYFFDSVANRAISVNVNFTSDNPCDITCQLMFHDGALYEFKVRLSGHGQAVHTVVGRKKSSAVHMLVEVAGHKMNDGKNTWHWPIHSQHGDDLFVNLAGVKDPWSQMLREAAMKIDPKDTVEMIND